MASAYVPPVTLGKADAERATASQPMTQVVKRNNQGTGLPQPPRHTRAAKATAMSCASAESGARRRMPEPAAETATTSFPPPSVDVRGFQAAAPSNEAPQCKQASAVASIVMLQFGQAAMRSNV